MGSDNVKTCVASYLKLHPSHVELCRTTVSDEKFCGLTFTSWAWREKLHTGFWFFSGLHPLCSTTQTCLHPQRLHFVVICLHNRQEMFVVPVQSLFLFSLSFSKSYLSLELHLGVGLVQPAVEVRSQKQRLLLLQCQPVPPALLLLLDLDVHQTLGGLVVDLKTVLESEIKQGAMGQQYRQMVTINVLLFFYTVSYIYFSMCSRIHIKMSIKMHNYNDQLPRICTRGSVALC